MTSPPKSLQPFSFGHHLVGHDPASLPPDCALNSTLAPFHPQIWRPRCRGHTCARHAVSVEPSATALQVPAPPVTAPLPPSRSTRVLVRSAARQFGSREKACFVPRQKESMTFAGPRSMYRLSLPRQETGRTGRQCPVPPRRSGCVFPTGGTDEYRPCTSRSRSARTATLTDRFHPGGSRQDDTGSRRPCRTDPLR